MSLTAFFVLQLVASGAIKSITGLHETFLRDTSQILMPAELLGRPAPTSSHRCVSQFYPEAVSIPLCRLQDEFTAPVRRSRRGCPGIFRLPLHPHNLTPHNLTPTNLHPEAMLLKARLEDQKLTRNIQR